MTRDSNNNFSKDQFGASEENLLSLLTPPEPIALMSVGDVEAELRKLGLDPDEPLSPRIRELIDFRGAKFTEDQKPTPIWRLLGQNWRGPSRKKSQSKSFFLRKVQQQQEKKLQAAQSSKRNGRKALPYSFATALLITLTVGVVAYPAYKMWPKVFTDLAGLLFASVSGPPVSPRFEALCYYLEIAPSDDATCQRAIRATGFGPVVAGAKFKFHFKPTEGGYFYVVALGENGVPQTFLTSRPMPSSGVNTNLSVAGKDFNFPAGGQWFMTRKDAESTPFTVIFSKTPLKAPAFLSLETGRDLTTGEQQELMDMKKRYADSAPELVAMKEGDQLFVSVQLPKRAGNDPIIFDISIKRARTLD